MTNEKILNIRVPLESAPAVFSIILNFHINLFQDISAFYYALYALKSTTKKQKQKTLNGSSFKFCGS